MKFKFGTHDAYFLPEGNYHAQFSQVAEPAPNPKCETPLRLTLDVLYPLPDNLPRKVAKTYCADCDRNNELINHLSSALQAEVEALLDEHDMLDAKKLIGRRVDITVEHVQTDGYDKPFIKLAEMFPAGTFKLKE
jgi:hypothetical protein